MPTLTLRGELDRPLTYQEMDDNLQFVEARAQEAGSSAESAELSAQFVEADRQHVDQQRQAVDAAAAAVDQAIANAGYVGTGPNGEVEDYAEGIEITARNQIIRADGELWRISASVDLPYATSGDWAADSGDFVAMGDAALRQELVQPVATFNNVQDMKDASGLDVGRKVRTLGYYAPGDGGGCDYEIVAAGTGSNFGFLYEQLTASGNEAKLLGGGIMENKTAYIPSDYDTLQEAVDSIHAKTLPMQGVNIDLLIETGHQPTSGISVSNGHYAYFSVSSVDPEVTLAAGFSSHHFLESNTAVSPTLNCLVDADKNCGIGVGLYSSSSGRVSSGCGVKNSRNNNLNLRQSTISANNTIWTGSGDGSTEDRCGLISQNSSASLNQADFSGSSSADGIRISQSSSLNGEGLVSENNARSGIRITFGSKAYIRFARASNNPEFGISAEHGCSVEARESEANNCANRGFQCVFGSSMDIRGSVATGCFVGVNGQGSASVDASNVDVSNATTIGIDCSSSQVKFEGGVATGHGTRGIRASRGGVIDATSANCQRAATPVSSDIWVELGGTIAAHNAVGGTSQTVNSLLPDGIIFRNE